MAKVRADQHLVALGLAPDEDKAKALLMAGLVYSGEQKITKPGDLLQADAVLTLRGRPHPWVSRGGLKLDHAITHLGWDVRDAVAIDVGASTGGFTDVLLHHGAGRVYAVDVGHGQLAWKLRTNPRVVVLDKTNARHLTAAHVPEPIDLVVCDAAFISLKSVLPASLALTQAKARLLALIKPQFEVARQEVGAGGVVTDPKLHARVCNEIHDWLQDLAGWQVAGITPSPITGPDGNHEFIIAATRGKDRT